MFPLFEADYEPEWILLVAGDDAQPRHQQLEELQRHTDELQKLGILIFEVSRTEIKPFHHSSRCLAEATKIARIYRLTFDRFTASLINQTDCVKWTAPTPVSFADLVSVIEEMPHREAENGTRGPALSR